MASLSEKLSKTTHRGGVWGAVWELTRSQNLFKIRMVVNMIENHSESHTNSKQKGANQSKEMLFFFTFQCNTKQTRIKSRGKKRVRSSECQRSEKQTENSRGGGNSRCMFLKKSSCNMLGELYIQDNTIKLDNSIEMVLVYSKVTKEGTPFRRSKTLM